MGNWELTKTPCRCSHGIDLDDFWDMWRVNPANFFGFHVSSSLIAIFFTIWSFRAVPSPVFCSSSNDPCTCKGGGFGILATFCAAAATAQDEESKNISVSNASKSFASIKQSAREEYLPIFQALEGSAIIAIVTLAVMVVIVLIFVVARDQLEIARVDREVAEAAARAADLKRRNELIQKE